MLCSAATARRPLPTTVATVGPLWDRQTDTVLFHRLCSAYCAGSANKLIEVVMIVVIMNGTAGK